MGSLLIGFAVIAFMIGILFLVTPGGNSSVESKTCPDNWQRIYIYGQGEWCVNSDNMRKAT